MCIYVGIFSSILNEGLVDEIWLAVHPVILGGGKPLFNDIRKMIKLHLADMGGIMNW